MKLQIVLVAFLQAVPVQPVREVSAYIGDNVILPSGADPSWNLSKVEWSIFTNNTWIATLRRGKIITEHFYRYRGRLRLNRTSGDLMISNLNINDAMEYHADLISTEGVDRVKKVKLIVRQRLREPIIKTVIVDAWPANGGCSALLRCSSPDEGVVFTWQVKPAGVPVLNASDGGGAVALWRIHGAAAQDRVDVTCTSRSDVDEASSVATLTCHDDKPPPVPPPVPPPQLLPQPMNSYCAAFFMGGVLAGLLAVIVMYILREQINTERYCIRDKTLRINSNRIRN